MYFKEEYNEYYEILADSPDTLRTSIAGMEDAITEVNNQFNSVALLINELKGEFATEFTSGLSSLVDEIEALRNLIDTSLSPTIDKMTDLGDKLGDLKPEDEEYEEKQAKYDRDSLKHVTRYEINENGEQVETSEYRNWVHNLEELKETIDKLIKICEQLQEGCDSDIAAIEKFNNTVIDLRLKLVAVATSMGDNPIEDIDSMTPQQKQEYLDKLLETITGRYNEYKELYEYYSSDYIRERCTDSQLYNFIGIYDALLEFVPDAIALGDVFDSKNPVTRGNSLVDLIAFLTNPDNGVGGRNILTIIEDYSNGVSWTESGMDELFRRNENGPIMNYLQFGGDAEEAFWSRATGGDYEFNHEMMDDFFSVVSVLSDARDGFLENYNNALNTAVMIKGIRGLKNSLIYDYTYRTADFDNYVPNPDLLWENGFDPSDYTVDECKMLSYLLETQGVGAAYCYIDARKDAINRRNGYLAAQDYYESLHNGSNTGLDSFADHFRVGAKGLGDGVWSFTDGLIDLVAPDNIMSEHDYCSLYLLQMMEESGDPYDHSLLVDYRVTNTVGVYAIPTVVSAVTGGNLGTALFIASDIGNGIESQMVQGHQQAMAYDSLVLEETGYSQALFESAIPYVGTDLPNDAFQAVLGMFTEINPILGAALDVTFDAGYHGLLNMV